MPSPVIVDKYLLVADDRGTANCFRTSDGERLWQTRMGKHYHASLVAANGLVHFMSDDGVTKVVRPDQEFDVVARNKIDDELFASPAIAQGRIYIRGERFLYAIGSAGDGS